MISYVELYEILRKERYNEDLQQLPKDFIKEVFEYLKEKKELSEKKEDLFSEAINKEKKRFENSKAVFREILMRRKKKILNLAFVASETGISKRDFENMLPHEKELFENVVKSLEKTEKSINEEMVGDVLQDNFMLVRFLEDVPAFLNMEGEELGPFHKGEIANLEKEIAEILKKDKKIEILED
ncbi:MAG: hypothetical protein QXG18_01300 [Candidatus Pacearchaeota archaeon]